MVEPHRHTVISGKASGKAAMSIIWSNSKCPCKPSSFMIFSHFVGGAVARERFGLTYMIFLWECEDIASGRKYQILTKSVVLRTRCWLRWGRVLLCNLSGHACHLINESVKLRWSRSFAVLHSCYAIKLYGHWLQMAWKLVNSLPQKAPINFYLMANNTAHNSQVKFGENWNCLLAVCFATRLSVACLDISLLAISQILNLPKIDILNTSIARTADAVNLVRSK